MYGRYPIIGTGNILSNILVVFLVMVVSRMALVFIMKLTDDDNSTIDSFIPT